MKETEAPVMKMEEHPIGSDIPIKFDVWVSGKPGVATSAGADIYDPDSRYIAAGPAKTRNSEVSFVLDGDKIEKVGIHTAIFKVTVRGVGETEHVVKFKVKKARSGNGKRN